VDELDPKDGLRERLSLPTPGTLIRRLALGSEATYRVLSKNDRGVEAPGLQPGARFAFTVADVVNMTDVSEGEHAAHAMRSGVPQRRYASSQGRYRAGDPPHNLLLFHDSSAKTSVATSECHVVCSDQSIAGRHC
jgi:hypothetical protein